MGDERRDGLEALLKIQLEEERARQVRALLDPAFNLIKAERFQPKCELERVAYAAKLSSVVMRRVEVSDLQIVHAGKPCAEAVWRESWERLSFCDQVRFLATRLERIRFQLPRDFWDVMHDLGEDIQHAVSKAILPYMRDLSHGRRNDAVIQLTLSIEMLLQLTLGFALAGDWRSFDRVAPLAIYLPNVVPICSLERNGAAVQYIFLCSPEDGNRVDK